MAVQYTDGTFSDTVPIEEAKRLFNEALEAGVAKALYAGTPEQIEQVKDDISAKEMIEDLQSRVYELEAEKRGIIHRPSYHELQRFGFVDLNLKTG